jgi:mannose-1-phosphate guanylyltransferase/mannose-6-phosphate isomerase
VSLPAEPSVVIDERPWGKFERYCLNEPVTVKIITVEPGHQLSLQRHQHRDELWVALDDDLIVEVDGQTRRAKTGDRFFVRRGQNHRVASPKDRTVRFLEVAFGDFAETDIERLADDYGRA